jgi:proteasome lid subunit RPN8/RPN11
MGFDKEEKRSFDKLRTSGEGVVAVEAGVIAAIQAATAAAHSHEACGILTGEGVCITGVIATPNIHPTPKTRFEIDPQALINAHRAERGGGAQVMGYFHSHPCGPPEPSATDRAMAAHDGKVWVIVGADEVRFWQDVPEGFRALSYVVLER